MNETSSSGFEQINKRREATHSTAGMFFAQELLEAISKGYIDLDKAQEKLKNVTEQARNMADANTNFETLNLVVQAALDNFPTTTEGNKTSELGTPSFPDGKHPFVGMSHNFWTSIEQGPQTVEAIIVGLERAQGLVNLCASDVQGTQEQTKKVSDVWQVLKVLGKL